MDKHFNDDHGQIPESSQFIPDSTLIPQSEQMYPEADERGDGRSSYGDGGLPGGNGEGVETFQAKKPSFMMKNLPLIVVLLLGTGIGGSFLYKKVLHPANPAPAAMSAAQPVEQAPTSPEPAAAPIPAQTPAPVEAQQNPPVQPAPAAQPEPVKQAASKAEAPTPVPAPVQKAETPTAFATPPAVKPEPVAAPVSPAVDARTAKDLEAERRRSDALKNELLDMQARMANLEKELRSTRSQLASVGTASPVAKVAEAAAPRTAAAVVQHPVTNHPAQSAKHKARAQTVAKKVAPERLEGYSVTAVRNGLAWITTPDGLTTVREGDTLPGVGRVTGMSESAMRVSIGNKFVQ